MNNELWLREDFHSLWQGQDPFVAAFALKGETFRALEQRQTLAFTVGSKRYFVKRHRGARWGEILKNLLQGRLPVVSAANEFRAIRALQALGVRAPIPVAYGRRGLLPRALQSFLITEDVGPHVSLEDYCRHWREQPPGFEAKRALIEALAAVARNLHTHGICHRDFYLCHFLRTPDGGLTVIDLHRALVKRHLARRWVVKDVAGLYFSALDCGLTRRDLYRFMRIYHACTLRETLTRDGDFWRTVDRRAQQLYQRERRKR